MPANTLNQYIAQIQSLLDDAAAAQYTTANLTTFINDARLQIAGSSESVRRLATLNFINGTQSYAYSTFTGLTADVQGVLSVRKGRVQVSGVWQEIVSREWEWFFSYLLNGSAAAATGAPATFAEQVPGVSGILYVNPIPNAALVSSFDCVCYPIALASNGDPEAIPYPWTEAIQYFAAYLAYLSVQRMADADKMFQRYMLFETRGTQLATPTVTPAQQVGGAGASRAAQQMPIAAPRGQGR